MATLDNASWHSGGDEFPEGLSEENGATHIGMFLGWLVINNLESEWLRSEIPLALESVRSKKITGRELLLEHCDGKFFSEMIAPEALGFVMKYYESNSGYLKDYRAILVQGLSSDYHVEDTWENFSKISTQITRRHEEWAKRKSKQPWWRFWK